MRVVLRTDPVVRATQLKQLLVNPVDLGPGQDYFARLFKNEHVELLSLIDLQLTW